jgi:L-cysteine S-thiosulfotransferase
MSADAEGVLRPPHSPIKSGAGSVPLPRRGEGTLSQRSRPAPSPLAVSACGYGRSKWQSSLGEIAGEGWGEGTFVSLALAVLMSFCGPALAGRAALEAYEIVRDTIPAPLGGLKGDVGRGEAIVRDRRVGNCIICHQFPIKDEPFQGEIGPSLIGIGTRLKEGQIRLRLVDESKINTATLMPPYYRIAGLVNVAPEYEGEPGLTAQQLEDVVAYLLSLKE